MHPIRYRFLRHRIVTALILVSVFPVSVARSVPINPVEPMEGEVTNLGLLLAGGTALSSSASGVFQPNQAFDGKLYAASKSSQYENGWVARGGSGQWIERQWPGFVSVVGITLTRRVNRVLTLCDKARDLEITLGSGSPITVRLADTNEAQYVALNPRFARSVRVTVRSTEGTACTDGRIGFAEIALYGTPVSWDPLPIPAPGATTAPTAVVPSNTITVSYDASIPLDSQAYLAQLVERLLPVMTEALGPPLQTQHLTVRLDRAYGAFTYAVGPSTITLSRLPNPAGAADDPSNLDFNFNLTHELAHAFQAGYGFSSPAWFREGYAQAAADLVKRIFQERGQTLLQGTTTDEGAALRTYDALAGMGPDALSAVWSDTARFLAYNEAEGLWWLLMLSQSSPRAHSTFAELDFLRRVESGLYAAKPGDSDGQRRAFLASLAQNSIDGMPASTWLERQPITWTTFSAAALGAVAGDCLCAGNTAAEAQHLYIMLRQYGFPAPGSPVRVLMRNESGETIFDQTVPYADHGFGFFYYTFPVIMDTLPVGRYDVTVDATVNGVKLRSTLSLARGSRTTDAHTGLGLARILAGPASPLAVTASVGSYQPAGAGNGTLVNLIEDQPQNIELTVNNRAVKYTVFLPAPFTRFVGLP